MLEQIRPLLAADASSPDSAAALEQVHAQLKAAAASIVTHSAESGHRDRAFQELLRARLSIVNDCDSRLYENSAKLPPF
jgi:hypothetical protein